MSEQIQEEQQRFRYYGALISPTRPSDGLQIVLWVVWTLAVLVPAFVYLRAAWLAAEPIDLIGMVVHCVLVGVIGLLVITLIEMRLEPWRFIDGAAPHVDQPNEPSE